MRAKLSQVDGGMAFLRAPLYCDFTGATHTHPDMARDDAFAAKLALAEARAILAETEPDGLTLTTHHGGRGCGGMLGWPEGCAALAESLAAFVEA